MPNTLAYVMLMIWPLACVVLFRKLPYERALIWSILGGYLILPPLAEFNLPLVPAMDKSSIPTLSVLLITLFVLRRRFDPWPASRAGRWLAIGLALSAFPTVLTNTDPIIFEVLPDADPIQFIVDQLPGQSWRDIGSVLIAQVLTLVPFLLARQFLSTQDGLRELLLALALGGLAYSVPALIEIRLSPQINTWIYGFFQHSFAQMMRGDGFRPIVFLPHALWLALFVATSLIAAAVLARGAPAETRWRWMLLVGYLALLLYLCKSLAALAYGIVLTPVVLLAPVRWQIRLAFVFGVVAVIYPMLRNAGLVPLDAILAQAEAISAERAHSLAYRFGNEEQLLDRAAQKPLFGWGGWGRSLIRHPETGAILSVPDGRWIIVFGTFGWLGYICEFGLLALPLVLALLYQMRAAARPLPAELGALALILGITMIDMLLNATLTPVTLLIAGAILGHMERRRAELPQRAGGGRSIPLPRQMRTGRRTVL